MALNLGDECFVCSGSMVFYLIACSHCHAAVSVLADVALDDPCPRCRIGTLEHLQLACKKCGSSGPAQLSEQQREDMLARSLVDKGEAA